MSTQAVVAEGVRVEIAECCLDTDADEALGAAWTLLDDDEQERAAGFVFPRDRDRFVRAHGFLRRRLGAALARPPVEVRIAAAANGKPFLAEGGARFNLSHSGGRAVLAIAADAEVGIDIELVDSRDGLEGQLDDLADAVLNADERRALADLPQARRVRRFLSYWTAKEARMKLTGEGMRLAPQAIALRLTNGRPVGYRRPHAPRAGLRFVPLSSPQAICCLAVRRAPE